MGVGTRSRKRYEPVGSHDGRELSYRNGDEESVAVEVIEDPTFAPGGQDVL